MTTTDQKRLRVLVDLEADRLSTEEAASALGISARQLRRLRCRLRSGGAAGLVHGNRGRRPANACEPELAEQVTELARVRYAGFNQQHFSELLAEHEGIELSRWTVRRMLAAEGIGSPRPQRRSRHRRRRLRRAQEGALLQLDASDHQWLGNLRLVLHGAIDDATGRIWAHFGLAEDLAGYFTLLNEILSECGVPAAVYTDRHAIFLGTRRTPERVRSGTTRIPSQLTRVFDELDIALIQARSPQAKGRIERLWKTLQDRLVAELRAQGIATLAGAEQLLQRHVGRHNRCFAVAAANPLPAWRSLLADRPLADILGWRHRRVVATDNTVSVDGQRFQIVFPITDPGWARSRVDVQRRLDGSWFVRRGGGTAPALPIPLPTRAAAA